MNVFATCTFESYKYVPLIVKARGDGYDTLMLWW